MSLCVVFLEASLTSKANMSEGASEKCNTLNVGYVRTCVDFSLKVGGSCRADKHHSLCGELVHRWALSQPPGQIAASRSLVFMGGWRPAHPSSEIGQVWRSAWTHTDHTSRQLAEFRNVRRVALTGCNPFVCVCVCRSLTFGRSILLVFKGSSLH